MTVTYDPHHPKYLDESDVRDELTRVYDLCQGCRLCFKFCSSFPTLFEFIDRHDDQDAATLTKAEQDQVVDECFQCKLCYVNCPYTPGRHEWELDFPRLMLRAAAMRRATKDVPAKRRLTDNVMGRTDLLGKAGTAAAGAANAMTARRGGIVRSLMEATTGIAGQRLLSPFARQRFTTWFKKRPRVRLERREAKVAVFPTCLVEYQAPAVGRDLVAVYERNGIECGVAYPGCCGAPFLHSGDIEHFEKAAAANVKALAAVARDGTDIVVPQPTCGYVLKKDYVDYVGGPDAELVAEHAFDAAEYLMKLHKEGSSLDLDFPGDVPETIAYHTPCHLRAQNIGFKSRDLMKLTGAKIRLVQQCSGIDGMWGLREENADVSLAVSKKLGDEISRAGSEVVAGDCHLANTAITEQTGRVPLHPIQVVARAYGIPEET
jgi:glycerol-3-phosphate dehydrogenase subunit C